jgi:SAM-dependent methyltransferase
VVAAHTLANWKDSTFAGSWADGDVLADMLDFPRRMAAAVIARETPAPNVVIDVGSGPGAFLAVFLDEFPQARGIWTDASEPMEVIARQRLARFGDRVEYRLVEMTDLTAADLPGDADVVLSSRASHHLDQIGLANFYAQAADRLRTGGWIVNLDHIGPERLWDARYRAVRPRFTGPRRDTRESHAHTQPLPSLRQHLDAVAAAGFADADVAWKAFATVLLMGAKAETGTGAQAETSGS